MGSGHEKQTDERELVIDLLRSFGVESQRLAEAFAQAQHLHPTDLRALLSVMHAEHRNEPLTPGRLAEHLGLSSGAVTAVIDRLEKAGHLGRTRDDPDRRVVHLHYDPKALALGREFFGPLAERSHAVMDDFTPRELRLTARFLAAMTKAISDFRAELESGGAGAKPGPGAKRAGPVVAGTEGQDGWVQVGEEASGSARRNVEGQAKLRRTYRQPSGGPS